jgi:hypothetical protein
LTIEVAIAGDDGLPSCAPSGVNSGDFRCVEHTALLRRGFDLEVYLTRYIWLRTPGLAFKLGQKAKRSLPVSLRNFFAPVPVIAANETQMQKRSFVVHSRPAAIVKQGEISCRSFATRRLLLP